MTKSELIDKITAKVNVLAKKADADVALNTILDELRGSLIAGESVLLTGFGTFKVIERAERKGHNPKTHEPITIPAKRVAKFIPAKSLKKAIN
ncbi:MAG: HU family DNA-binding protein [Desulfovibrio sp.]|nr:HU family DNA-binding protein [Desulfovibrio sp.]